MVAFFNLKYYNFPMKKYINPKDFKTKIATDGYVHLAFHASGLNDIIHSYSVPGYEYLTGSFVEFLDRFRPVIPHKAPIVLEITGTEFSDAQKDTIDKAVWMHYGLYLSEADLNLKKKKTRLALFLILMLLSSCFLFLVANFSNEVVINYGYILFWFFAYRVFTYLILDCLPIYKEYLWYRHLASLKLVFSDDDLQSFNPKQLSIENARYEHEANFQTKKHLLLDQVLIENSCVSLGCRIEHPEDVLCPSGVADIDIISDEMADYLLSALPFIKQKYITKLEITGASFTAATQKRISDAVRNYFAFLISGQEVDRQDNRNTSIIFAIGLLLSTIFLYIWGKNVNVAIHEFFMVAFWFFADYLLEFVLLSRTEINSMKKTLEKLANMEITFI